MASPSGTWSNNQPPSTFEKLWRGLILVGVIHLGGMFVNVGFRCLETTALMVSQPNSPVIHRLVITNWLITGSPDGGLFKVPGVAAGVASSIVQADSQGGLAQLPSANS